MAGTFSFGFAGDDIDDIDDVNENEPGQSSSSNSYQKETYHAESSPELFPAKRHQLQDWLTTLPSQISYNKLPLRNDNHDGGASEQLPTSLLLGRREVFDIRAQLMAEDDPDHEELIISGLEEGDIKPKFYEGGFKTWECALDLAKLLTSSSDSTIPDAGDLHVIEMGCGTAMPSLAILARLLTLPVASSSSRRKVHFTLADYNSTVLRLVTLSNLLLTWKLNTTRQAGQHEDDGSQTEEDTVDEGGDELDIDSTFLDAFQNDLAQRAISIDFVSGAWSPRFVELALTSSPREEQVIPLNTIILASETIYAPSSLTPFSETLLDLLRRTTAVSASCRSEALIAAKKVYFGVGGGIDEFLHVLHQQPLKEKETIDVHQGVEVKTEGVGRVILQIGIQRS